MNTYMGPALESPNTAEFYAWFEHVERRGDLDEWAADWAATVDPENYRGDVRKAVEDLIEQRIEVYLMTPDFADRYEDRNA